MSSVVIISKPTMKMLIFISNRVTTKEQNGEFIETLMTNASDLANLGIDLSLPAIIQIRFD